MKTLKDIHLKVMAYYHQRILNFYSGSKMKFSLPHMHFDEEHNPRLILYDYEPVFIGHIEVDKEGVSNFIHNTPMVIGCDNKCEILDMQDFIHYGRLFSLSAIRQSVKDDHNKKFYAYQTTDKEKSKRYEIFPILRADKDETSYLLRQDLNQLLQNREKQIELSLFYNKAEFEWIINNEERFSGICSCLKIAMFKTPEKIMLTHYDNIEETTHETTEYYAKCA